MLFHSTSASLRRILSSGLKCLQRAVHCTCVLLRRAEIERCESRSTREDPSFMPLALPDPNVRRKRHESITDRGVRNGPAALGQHESQEGRSHARSTSQSHLVAHPGADPLLTAKAAHSSHLLPIHPAGLSARAGRSAGETELLQEGDQIVKEILLHNLPLVPASDGAEFHIERLAGRWDLLAIRPLQRTGHLSRETGD